MNILPTDTVLDMCCSPGAKLLEIADTLLSLSKNQSLLPPEPAAIHGNDITLQRLKICKKFLEKHRVSKFVDLHNEDACTFNPKIRYDKILCDVECSHDGSLKHILKFLEKSKNFKNSNPQNIEEVVLSKEEKIEKIKKNNKISKKEKKRRVK